ncbi:hypothetical protein BLNAU_24851 [Blattamonas nauphoetae]|uniref:Uncharacterized protein n=1 Tax=Blattamonas nauphoetae TaxID=2049346 RepID=A0ABQ9WLA7_9EUKA|nr:hypothetical protein BLNAU_24851 [Blattamonas nauphoetae]
MTHSSNDVIISSRSIWTTQWSLEKGDPSNCSLLFFAHLSTLPSSAGWEHGLESRGLHQEADIHSSSILVHRLSLFNLNLSRMRHHNSLPRFCLTLLRRRLLFIHKRSV